MLNVSFFSPVLILTFILITANKVPKIIAVFLMKIKDISLNFLKLRKYKSQIEKIYVKIKQEIQ
jgi:hypothetical protein